VSEDSAETLAAQAEARERAEAEMSRRKFAEAWRRMSSKARHAIIRRRQRQAAKAFYDGKLTASTALVVVRIPHVDLQKKALTELFRYHGHSVPSFSEVTNLVQREFMLALKGASFPVADVDLVKGAGARGTCPKRTGAQRQLFSDVESHDVCTDPVCFKAKTEAGWERKKLEFQGAGKKVLNATETKAAFGSYGELNHDADYVTLDQICHKDPKYRTYKQLIGKASKDLVVLAQDPKGQMRELVPKKELGKLLKRAGHDFKAARSTTRASGKDSPAAKRAREERELDEATAGKVTAAVVAKLEAKEPDAALWRLAATQLSDNAEMTMARRLGGDTFAYDRKKVIAYVSGLKEDQARAMAFELALEAIIYFEGYGAENKAAREQLLKWAGVDEKAIQKLVAAERKKAEPLDALVGSRADAVKRHEASKKKGAGRG
jgi:hypothetical protein